MQIFSNKLFYVIGGSSGIGLATAGLLSGKGAHIIIFARSPVKLKPALDKIQKNAVSSKQNFGYMALDVADAGQVNEVMARAVAKYGVPDGLINCAGRSRPHRFEQITAEMFDETIKINLYGTRNTIAALVPLMKKKGGYIVNTASVAGFIGVFGFTDYSASKFAVIGFSEALKSELKPWGITVSVLCPPDTDTPGFQIENRTKPAETAAISAGAGLMQPEDVARALIKGMCKNKFMIIPGFDGKLSFWAKRLLPRLVEWIMNRAIRRVGTGGPTV